MVDIVSDFAILDVKRGRAALRSRCAREAKKVAEARQHGCHYAESACYECEALVRIPVVIRGFVTHAHSRDDGVSQEFSVLVEKLEIG